MSYPEINEVGARDLGQIILYSILNSLPNSIPDWVVVISELINKKELLWSDKDKKGNPIDRNCRPSLVSSILINLNKEINKLNTPNQVIMIGLEGLIYPQGKSVKPIQIRYWLKKHFLEKLGLAYQIRDELKLFQC